ncbi:MAG: hypothetical protein LWW95_09905 [Candidatus Desulfofervidus auxilii]|nr:hypothetical protein [Candidatus Desulfofervidus auxilii]
MEVEKVIQTVKKKKPKLIFSSTVLLPYFRKDYRKVREWRIGCYYLVLLLKQ